GRLGFAHVLLSMRCVVDGQDARAVVVGPRQRVDELQRLAESLRHVGGKHHGCGTIIVEIASDDDRRVGTGRRLEIRRHDHRRHREPAQETTSDAPEPLEVATFTERLATDDQHIGAVERRRDRQRVVGRVALLDVDLRKRVAHAGRLEDLLARMPCAIEDRVERMIAKRDTEVAVFDGVQPDELLTGCDARAAHPRGPMHGALATFPQVESDDPLLRGNAHTSMVRSSFTCCQSEDTTGLARRPRSIPSISTQACDPGTSAVTPSGVPVKTRSPGVSVMHELMWDTSRATENAISPIAASWRRTPSW